LLTFVFVSNNHFQLETTPTKQRKSANSTVLHNPKGNSASTPLPMSSPEEPTPTHATATTVIPLETNLTEPKPNHQAQSTLELQEPELEPTTPQNDFEEPHTHEENHGGELDEDEFTDSDYTDSDYTDSSSNEDYSSSSSDDEQDNYANHQENTISIERKRLLLDIWTTFTPADRLFLKRIAEEQIHHFTNRDHRRQHNKSPPFTAETAEKGALAISEPGSEPGSEPLSEPVLVVNQSSPTDATDLLEAEQKLERKRKATTKNTEKKWRKSISMVKTTALMDKLGKAGKDIREQKIQQDVTRKEEEDMETFLNNGGQDNGGHIVAPKVKKRKNKHKKSKKSRDDEAKAAGKKKQNGTKKSTIKDKVKEKYKARQDKIAAKFEKVVGKQTEERLQRAKSLTSVFRLSTLPVQQSLAKDEAAGGQNSELLSGMSSTRSLQLQSLQRQVTIGGTIDSEQVSSLTEEQHVGMFDQILSQHAIIQDAMEGGVLSRSMALLVSMVLLVLCTV